LSMISACRFTIPRSGLGTDVPFPSLARRPPVPARPAASPPAGARPRRRPTSPGRPGRRLEQAGRRVLDRVAPAFPLLVSEPVRGLVQPPRRLRLREHLLPCLALSALPSRTRRCAGRGFVLLSRLVSG
jgi:hypothetical protein